MTPLLLTVLLNSEGKREILVLGIPGDIGYYISPFICVNVFLAIILFGIIFLVG
jgi:hypothetical protein